MSPLSPKTFAFALSLQPFPGLLQPGEFSSEGRGGQAGAGGLPQEPRAGGS